MNTLLHAYDTPKNLQRKLKDVFTEARVSTGASGQAGKDQWEKLSLWISSLGSDDDSSSAYILNMDRETAARVVEHLTKYLGEKGD